MRPIMYASSMLSYVNTYFSGLMYIVNKWYLSKVKNKLVCCKFNNKYCKNANNFNS